MLIKVQTLTGENIDIENVKPTDTIRSIKEAVERIEGISADYQKFVAHGQELTDCQIAEECCLTDGIVICLVLKPRSCHTCGESCCGRCYYY